MSGRDVSIILAALCVTAASIAGSAALLPSINRQRADLQLTFNPDVTASMPADVAFLYTALGSFRGLAVDFLWGWAGKLKDDGKFYQAMELSRMITKLQPRFPQVWVFQSWNMAYNISVATHTPEERWMWVQAGVKLLRDEGIPLNPTSVGVYRQLGWTFLHKIAGVSDDMHWYYKQMLALEWQELLGRPPEGSTQAMLAWMEPVAEMDRRCFAGDILVPEVREPLEQLLVERQDLEPLRRLKAMDPLTFAARIDGVIADLDERERQVIAQLGELKDINAGYLAERRRDPVERFESEHPQAADQLRMLRELGFKLDATLLRRIGRVQTRQEAAKLGYTVESMPGEEEADAKLGQWLSDESPDAARVRDEMVLPFLRAKVLRETYHMSALFMLEVMRGGWLVSPENPKPEPLPLDWRHPAAHGLYWSLLGVRAGQSNIDRGTSFYFEQLNTYRQVLQALQLMLHNGRIVFQPAEGYFELLPDPRYIEGYGRGLFGSQEVIGDMFEESDAPESFRAGYENFLVWAMGLAYWWGDRDKAEELYARLGRLYATKPGRMNRYSQPLEEFMLSEAKQNVESLDQAKTMVAGLIQQAIMEGYVNSRPDLAELRVNFARQLYDHYQKQMGWYTPSPGRHRMSLLPFDQMVVDTFQQFLLAPAGAAPVTIKQQAWRNVPTAMKQAVWDRVRVSLYEQAQQSGLAEIPPEIRFPQPPGMEEYRQQHPVESQTEAEAEAEAEPVGP